MAAPLLFFNRQFISELYLLTKYSGKYLPFCLVGMFRSTTFASAFRKEAHLKTIFDTISYRQVVRRAYLS
jgi:hypothetical protein